MKLDQLLDTTLLNQHIAERLVSVQYHPTLPLRILNYTHLAQFNPKWGDGAIDYCRGLIVDNEDRVISRPFKKFHNLNTSFVPETLEENLPNSSPVVTQKLDGSLGVHYWYDHFEGIATRGSFTSPQAQWATAWYNKKKANFKGSDKYDKIEWPYSTTALFEIIYPENRIVVNYDFEGLVLIGLVDNELGFEWGVDRAREVAEHNEIPYVKTYENLPLSQFKVANVENEEGYVLTYLKQDEPPLKVKIKMADYVRLHRIVTGMNARSVWELLKSGDDLSKFDKGFPEPFTNWLFKWRAKLEESFVSIQHRAVDAYLNRPFSDQTDPRRHRAEYAAYVKTRDSDLKGLLFALFDGKDINGAIWDLIEPRGDDKTFREEGE